jgi:hypothetical protein
VNERSKAWIRRRLGAMPEVTRDPARQDLVTAALETIAKN